MIRLLLLFVLPLLFHSCRGKEGRGVDDPGTTDLVEEVLETAPALDESIQVATVDMNRIVVESPLGKQAQRELSKLKALVDSGSGRRKAAVDALERSLDKAPRRTPADKRRAETTRIQLQALKKESGTYLKRKLKQLKLARIESKTRVSLASKKHIDTLAKAKGYIWVLDRAGNSMSEIPVLLHVKGTHPDLTSEVLRRMGAGK